MERRGNSLTDIPEYKPRKPRRGNSLTDIPEYKPRKPRKTRAYPPLIISLCDYSGTWCQPYRDAGYDVIQVDIEHGQDVRLYQMPTNRPVRGVLAAPPCTVFAKAGNAHHRTDSEIIDGLSVVDACIRIAAMTKPRWWCLENPVGKLVHYIGPPSMRFHPCEYGDGYTKYTCLWGDFTHPTKTHGITEDDYIEGEIRQGYATKGIYPSRSIARAITPQGFAEAFFKANP